MSTDAMLRAILENQKEIATLAKTMLYEFYQKERHREPPKQPVAICYAIIKRADANLAGGGEPEQSQSPQPKPKSPGPAPVAQTQQNNPWDSPPEAQQYQYKPSNKPYRHPHDPKQEETWKRLHKGNGHDKDF